MVPDDAESDALDNSLKTNIVGYAQDSSDSPPISRTHSRRMWVQVVVLEIVPRETAQTRTKNKDISL